MLLTITIWPKKDFSLFQGQEILLKIIFIFIPATDPRKWIYGDGTPISWSNWKHDEPNDHGDGEPYVEVDPDELWNDVSSETFRKFMCVHYLPAGAEETCPWLIDYTD